MTSRDLSRLMWSEALSLLEQADRLHRQFIRPAASQAPAWEPPVDIVETAEAVCVHVALPGVAVDSVAVQLEPSAITISAHRPFPVSSSAGQQVARIHALEIPYGRFERRIGLPTQALTLSGRKLQDGCLTLIFSKKESA
ncbi:MAG TPA: Hsp20/alpha crystallin family protein [Burkholderiales bacterium]|jgi:HSP20 family molecular chaperone IbpA|nr:Hsp20/alpha crystallin family protein [Burkholderiales bacterium]